MKYLSRALLTVGLSMMVSLAILLIVVRFSWPHLGHYSQQILQEVSKRLEGAIAAEKVETLWQKHGPVVVLTNSQLLLSDSLLHAEKVTVGIDLWRSLWYWRWQFDDISLTGLNGELRYSLSQPQSSPSVQSIAKLKQQLLHQFNYFSLYDSEITLLEKEGKAIKVEIPHLVWLNEKKKHQADGELRISFGDIHSGEVQLRLQLDDKRAGQETGLLYLQVDEINLLPWLGKQYSYPGLQKANATLAGWFTLQDGALKQVDLLVKEGEIEWQGAAQSHQLLAKELQLQLSPLSAATGWQLTLPALPLMMDGQPWSPSAQLQLLWHSLQGTEQQELRVRATDIELKNLSPLLSFFTLPEELKQRLDGMQPQGKLAALALDIPISKPEESCFLAEWQELSWQQWQNFPGGQGIAGRTSGCIAQGALTLDIDSAVIPYEAMFRAPLEIQAAKGILQWDYSKQKGWRLWSDQLDVRAKSLWAHGRFNFSAPAEGRPFLGILAGLRLDKASEAWRYYPQPLMGTTLTNYLTQALKAGEIDNATLIYAGDPQAFPYQQNEGLFQVFVPLRHALFEFQQGWPALEDLAIDLNFINNGLWMTAPKTKLGRADGYNIVASIPEFHQQKLLIDAEISGQGADVHDYFNHSPLRKSVGLTLDTLTVTGNVNGRLHLNIPLTKGVVQTTGEVTLQGNQLTVQPLNFNFEQVSGSFSFVDGNLQSDKLSALWFGQPVALDFLTKSSAEQYQIDIDLSGKWLLNQLPEVPKQVTDALAGSGDWKSQIAINLPHSGEMNYQVNLLADLGEGQSYLPHPLDKVKGEALAGQLLAKGGSHGFTLQGSFNGSEQFNSEWKLAEGKAQLLRGSWVSEQRTVPKLPKDHELHLQLRDIDGAGWLALLFAGQNKSANAFNFLPGAVTLMSPSIRVAGQAWHNVMLRSQVKSDGLKVTAKSREIEGVLRTNRELPWRLELSHLNYDPFIPQESGKSVSAREQSKETTEKVPISFRDWPDLQLRCQDCWFKGKQLLKLDADLTVQGERLHLTRGRLETPNSQITAEGVWQQSPQAIFSSAKGRMSGKHIEKSADELGFAVPMRLAPFELDFDLKWQGAPWQLKASTLMGTLQGEMGKGGIRNMSGGKAGRILSMVSIDALWQRLHFDFSDTFGKDFYFSSIKAKANVANGVINTQDMEIDGATAGIRLKGNVDLVKQQLDVQAVVAPTLSTTAGVATAFVVNPIMGAAVYAVSKVLGPVWSEYSLLRYHISGSLKEPKVDEVSRQRRKEGKKR